MNLSKLPFILLVLIWNVFCFSTSNIEVFKKFPNQFFIETGSFHGEGIQAAIDCKHFQKIFSIELSPKYFQICKKKFMSENSVKIIFGDSMRSLTKVLREVNGKATFWLDGHNSCGDTARGCLNSPIMQELEQIKSHYIKNHTILIDDVRLMGGKSFDFVSKEMIESKIKEINPNYIINYFDSPAGKGDILGAYLLEDS